MARTLVIGDVHGCADELEMLLDGLAVVRGTDRVVLVGDLVARGPDAARVLRACRELDARAVRGNHEARLLRFHARGGTPGADPGLGPRASEHVRRAAAGLDEADFRFLASLPLALELPEHGLVVVHAGLLPGVPLAEQQERTLLYVRTLDDAGAPSELRDGGVPWGTRYTGPPHVAFGHNALAEPQLHPWATGLDTGCVYGGRLTALVLDAGEPVPPVPARRAALASVPARRAYAPIDPP
ncbi:MAG: metallophosphoesterase [Polyangiaceae bacterium]|nr:metallophosphoesterase [Polyangiaceae bacterium]